MYNIMYRRCTESFGPPGAIWIPRIRAGERRVGACPVAVCANRLRSHGLSAGPEPNAMCRDDEVNGARKLGASSDFAP